VVNARGNSVENFVGTAVEMMPGRNGGRLRRGGKAGNRGGGRPPNALRADLRALLDGPGREVLKAALTGDDPALALRAVELCAKYSIGTRDEKADTGAVVIRIVRDGDPTDISAAVIRADCERSAP
jgi:hypothetical protein